MSLLREIQEFITKNPGVTSGAIAEVFASYPRMAVISTTGKLRQHGRVAFHRSGTVYRHFGSHDDLSAFLASAESAVTQPGYVGSGEPKVVRELVRKAQSLESKGLYQRAATIWLEAFRESWVCSEREEFLRCRARCLRRSKKVHMTEEGWFLAGNYVGPND